MADGVFRSPNFADTMGDLLRARAQQTWTTRAMTMKMQQDQADKELQARSQLMGRLTLTQPGGGQAPFSTYLAGLQGSSLPGITAEPTPAFAGAQRNVAQAGEAGARNHTELVKNLKNYDTGKWKQDDYSTYFGTGQLPPGTKPMQKPAGPGGRGGGKTPEEKLIAEQTRLDAELKQAQGEDQKRMGGSMRAYSSGTLSIQKQLEDVKTKISALQGTGKGGANGGGAPPAISSEDEYNKLAKGARYTWNGAEHVKN